jgi:protein arginine kinase activator
MGLSGTQKNIASELSLACPRCGMAREEFRKTGRLGCPECYKTFMAELTMAIKAMHHSGQHLGKIPAREGVQTRMKSKIARLQKDLEAAIAREDFEQAAKLRDQIKKCRDEGGSDEKDRK